MSAGILIHKGDDVAKPLIRTPKEELKHNFCESYQLWSDATWIYRTFGEGSLARVEELWNNYVTARELWIPRW